MASLRKKILQFEFDYSKVKDLRAVDFIESPSFVVGGYKWAIRFYVMHELNNELVLTLLSEGRKVQVQFCLEILNKYNNIMATDDTQFSIFNSQGDSRGNLKISTSSIQEATYEDTFFVRCEIEVLSELKREVHKLAGFNDHMKELLKRGKRSDVTFEVEGKMFTAHRLILAARSPVFEVELFGQMSDGAAKNIEIKDMRADVFQALLSFIYTDEISDDDLTIDLLVAAERYALKKLKAMCEERLCDDLSVETVVTTLILADRHSCGYLKDQCLQFASKMEHFEKLAFTKEYFAMESYPDLLSELGKKVAKRRRIN